MAIVNGFNTKKIIAQLSRVTRYEIFYLDDDYYIIEGPMLLRCGYDLIEEIQSTLGMMIPQRSECWAYDVRSGWSKAPYERLHRYLTICNECRCSYGENKTMSAVKTDYIKYSKQANIVVYTLENGEKVLLNKRYVDMMAASKKWGWFSEGKDRLSAIHFMNKQNIYEMWVLPIRYKDGTI